MLSSQSSEKKLVKQNKTTMTDITSVNVKSLLMQGNRECCPVCVRILELYIEFLSTTFNYTFTLLLVEFVFS